MKKYILTGAPGCGKTSLIKILAEMGHCVSNEAATDIIASEQKLGNSEPWLSPTFINHIVSLQKERQIQLENNDSTVQFFDRSPICTYALAVYMGYEPSSILLAEIDRIQKNNIYEQQVFFIDNLGFCEPTAARTISFEEALKFEKVHIDTYNQFGYQLHHVALMSIPKRVENILQAINA